MYATRLQTEPGKCVCVCVCVCVEEREIYGLDKEREIAGVYKVSNYASFGTIKTTPFFRVLLFMAQTVHALFTLSSACLFHFCCTCGFLTKMQSFWKLCIQVNLQDFYREKNF